MTSNTPSWSLITLYRQTFVLVGRYFVIVYPIFLYFIIVSLVVPTVSPDLNHWAWWIILIGLVAIFFIFQAGWSTMMHKAMQDWREWNQSLQVSSSEELPKAAPVYNPFQLLKHFIPGVGEQGLSFLLGGALWFLLFIFLPAKLLLWVGETYIGVPEIINTLQSNPTITQKEMNDLFLALTDAERQQLSAWSLLFLGIFFVWGCTSALSLLWQQFIIIEKMNPLKAFLCSFRQMLNYPLKNLIISLSFVSTLIFFIIMSSMSSFLAFIGNFLLIVSFVFFGLLLFQYFEYTYVKIEKPS